MKDDKFLEKEPNLSGDEEVVARAGEGKDPWINAKIEGTIGLMKPQLTDEGKLTEPYKKLLEQLHMVDLKPVDSSNLKKDKKIERLKKKWKQIQYEKALKASAARERIELQKDGYILGEIDGTITK